MRAHAALLLALSPIGCGAPILRPLTTTDAARELEMVTRSDQNEFDPTVSPDGKSLAYEVAASEDAMPHVEIMTLDAAGIGRGRIAYSSGAVLGLHPTWMPDGSGLVFVSRTRGVPRGLVQAFNTAGRTTFVADAGDPFMPAERPAVSPDGQTMAMAIPNVEVFESGWRRARHYDRALGLSDLLGTGVDVVGTGTDPAFSPDGKKLAFARFDDGHAHLFVANADGSHAVQITRGPADDIEPAWSPNGSYLVFCSAHGEGTMSQANLFVVRPDGSGLLQLTEGDRIACRPTWTKDGHVYFHANATSGFHVWRVRLGDGLIERG